MALDKGLRMIDISEKGDTERVSVAQGRIALKPETIKRIQAGEIEKGDVLKASELAGIMGAKRVPELIPLCHPLLITHIDLNFNVGSRWIEVTAAAKNIGRTGVEMEALTAVTVALLTIYDMCKAIDDEMRLEDILLLEKEGGKSGHWRRESLEQGRVLYVAASRERDWKERKREIDLIEGLGVEGDFHAAAGSPRQVSLLPIEVARFAPPDVLQDMEQLTENITTVGIPLESVQVGDLLLFERGAAVEVTEIGKEAYEDEGRKFLLSRYGIFGRVLKGGQVGIGERVLLTRKSR